MTRYGIIGRNISYSFSPNYFKTKFEVLELKDHTYEIFDLEDISLFPGLIENNPSLCGLNVTIPYKEAIIPFMDEVDPVAAEIGAVNTICFLEGKLKGYNTDIIGFEKSMQHLLLPTDKQALVLGTGGASKAVRYVLDKLGLKVTQVSRTASEEKIDYESISAEIIHNHTIIINCTPIGTYPDIESKPQLPYQAISASHCLFDLIYNPPETAFLEEGIAAGSRVFNGYAMLVGQAEASWDLWQST